MDLSRLFALVDDVDMVAVATTCCNLRLVRRGPRYESLCPNPHHHDKHMGSFSINPANKCWGCFACDLGQHYGNVSLVSELQGISKVEAAVRIGLDFGLISQDEATAIENGQSDKKSRSRSTRDAACIRRTPSFQVPCKAPELLDIVYRSFIEVSPPMTLEQRTALMAERNLVEADMDDFFILPDKSPGFWTAFKQRLAENGQTGTLNDILSGVPGFMRHKSNHRWSFVGKSGCLCLVSRNAAGRIAGFQMHCPNGPSKYIFFSSGSVDSDLYDSYCSSGPLVDVIPPRNKPSSVIAVTEGKYKGIALAKMGVWAISIAGVASWKRTLGPIREVCKTIAPKQPMFLVCFDADLKENYAVAKNAKQLALSLKKGFSDKVYFADWSPEHGKGIDDVVNAGNSAHLHRYPADEYLKNPFFSAPENGERPA